MHTGTPIHTTDTDPREPLSANRSNARFTRFGALAAALLLTSACTHVVGFDPVVEPTLETRIGHSVGLFMPADLQARIYQFRAAGSGLANEWQVAYGERIHAYATTYLRAAASGFTQRSSRDEAGSDLLVDVTDVGYSVSGQGANVSVSIDVRDGSGRERLSRVYEERGPSRGGAVFGGGVFAQKGATRSSTNVALDSLFNRVVADLSAL